MLIVLVPHDVGFVKNGRVAAGGSVAVALLVVRSLCLPGMAVHVGTRPHSAVVISIGVPPKPPRFRGTLISVESMPRSPEVAIRIVTGNGPAGSDGKVLVPRRAGSSP